jgi:hypothetical protein
MGSRSSTWQRVSRRRPCPVCGRPDWCLFTGDDDAPTAAICARVESEKRAGEAGWVHRLRDDGPVWTPTRRLVKAELLRIAADLASKPDEKPADEPAATDAATMLATMPESVRGAARAMLDSHDLMQTVVQDIGRLGVAGERELGVTLYLAGVSRLLPHPLAVILQGPSSSGKSFVAGRVSKLFPPEAVLTATQLTPQALFYLDPGSLVHRLVVVGERSRMEELEAAEATRALREMLSDGQLPSWCP